MARLALSSKAPPGLVQPPLISRWSVLFVETSIKMSDQTDVIDNEMAGVLALKEALEFRTDGKIVGLYCVYHVLDALKDTVVFIENKEEVIAILAGLRLRVGKAIVDVTSFPAYLLRLYDSIFLVMYSMSPVHSSFLHFIAFPQTFSQHCWRSHSSWFVCRLLGSTATSSDEVSAGYKKDGS